VEDPTRESRVRSGAGQRLGRGLKVAWHAVDTIGMTLDTVGSPLHDTVDSLFDELGGKLAGAELQAHLASIVENSDDAIISKDLSGTILSWNRGAERLYGYTRHEAIGQRIYLIVPDELRSEVDSFLARVAAGARVDHHDTRRVRQDGSTVEVSITISPICGADGTVSGASVIARDISERKRLERRLVQLAGEDQLTGIANRRTFVRRLEHHIDLCARHGWLGAVIVVDLDRFKSINDTLGHSAGDQVLKQTVARLRRRLRGTDLPARMGGDEFAVLLPDALPAGAERVASSIVAEIARQEITIRGERCATVSVGWARIDEAVAADELMIRADLAVYEAKRSGGNRACGYSPDRDTRFDEPLPDDQPHTDDRAILLTRDRDPSDLSLPAGAEEAWEPVPGHTDR
jgi:diguanylate cyclase (GGDEF)-like protein/PAS domain S-box-containing protein